MTLAAALPRRYRTVAHGAIVVASFSALFILFFSPVLLSGGRPSAKLLAHGDAWQYYLPNFLSGVVLWEPLLYSGYPVASDPQAMTWYPLARFFSLVHSWNGFVLSAYVLASSFTYGYVLTVTRSRPAALVAACTYGLSGFLIVRQGHLSILHAAAWLPMLIWAMEAGCRKPTFGSLGAAAVAVAMAILSGHPQATMHVLATGAVYGALRGLSVPGRLRYYGWAIASFSLGLLLAAIQLVPSLELARLGTRAHLTYLDFTAVSLPPSQAMQILFPMLFGGTEGERSFYGHPYFGASWFVELTGYVGLLPLLLAAMAMAAGPRNRYVLLWGGIGLGAFLLALGSSGPFTWLLYHVPVYNKFNAPARHLVEFTFAISVLSAWGVVAVERGSGVRRAALLSVVGLLALMAISVIYLHRSGALRAAAAANGMADPSLSPQTNPAIAVPLGVALVAAAGLMAFAWKPRSRLRQFALVPILVADLGSFGYFQYWKYVSVDDRALRAPPMAEKYRPLLAANHQRMLPVRGAQGGLTALAPNVSRLWQIPNASGYGPLLLGRMSAALSMQTDGALRGRWSRPRGRELDLLAVRYVFIHRAFESAAPGESEVLRGHLEANDGSSSDPARPARWRFVEQVGHTRVYENLRALPRAWLVGQVLRVSARQALDAVRTSSLPDARRFNPRRVALVEEPFSLEGPSAPGVALVAALSRTTMDIHVSSPANTFLVVSDVYYPGWKAYVDDSETRIYQTNFLLRGIAVPPGQHRVHFAYRPMSFYVGAFLSACAFTLLVTLVVLSARKE